MIKFITIVSAAMAAFITISCAAQTPTVASPSHIELEAFKAFKVEEQYLFQMPGSWKRLDAKGTPSFALAASSEGQAANWVISSEDSPVTRGGLEATVAAMGAVMEVEESVITEVGGTKPFFTVKMTVKKVDGKRLDMRQAYHRVSVERLVVVTFTTALGDKDADAAWAVLQLAPTLAKPVIPLITMEEYQALLSKSEEPRRSYIDEVLFNMKQQPLVSKPTMAEEMAQRRADHRAHGLWYKPWTW